MRAIGAVVAIAVFACSPAEQKAPAAEETRPAESQPLHVDEWEPADAQARAEAVVHAEFNRDKTKTLAMTIKPLTFRTSELSGMASQLASREDKIEDTLSRLGAKVTETEVLIQLPGAILFDFDSASIRADAERALNDVARVIQSYDGRPVRVEGHTDSIASDDYNQVLSQRRATSVVDWLAEHGVARPRLASAGLGETKPVATNDTAAGRQLNRRVEVVIARK
jgi:outer membrane protein OmpA-like peptidoglycan-associated protein